MAEATVVVGVQQLMVLVGVADMDTAVDGVVIGPELVITVIPLQLITLPQ
jgi:hypothetical protein